MPPLLPQCFVAGHSAPPLESRLPPVWTQTLTDKMMKEKNIVNAINSNQIQTKVYDGLRVCEEEKRDRMLDQS